MEALCGRTARTPLRTPLCICTPSVFLYMTSGTSNLAYPASINLNRGSTEIILELNIKVFLLSTKNKIKSIAFALCTIVAWFKAFRRDMHTNVHVLRSLNNCRMPVA